MPKEASVSPQVQGPKDQRAVLYFRPDQICFTKPGFQLRLRPDTVLVVRISSGIWSAHWLLMLYDSIRSIGVRRARANSTPKVRIRGPGLHRTANQLLLAESSQQHNTVKPPKARNVCLQSRAAAGCRLSRRQLTVLWYDPLTDECSYLVSRFQDDN